MAAIAAEDQENVTLLSSVTLSEPLNITSNKVIDLDGKTINFTSSATRNAATDGIVVAAGKTVTLKNGTIKYNGTGSAIRNNSGVLTLTDVNVEANGICVNTFGTWIENETLDEQRSERTVYTKIKGGKYVSTATAAHENGQAHQYAINVVDNALLEISDAQITGEGGVAANCSDIELTNCVTTVATCDRNDTYGVYLVAAGNLDYDETCKLGTVKAQVYNGTGTPEPYFYKAFGKVVVNDFECIELETPVFYGGYTWTVN